MWENVVADVVAIVPTFVVVEVVDAGAAVFIMIAGVFGIHERVLRPVAQHGYEAEYKERENKGKERSREVDKTQGNHHGIKRNFTSQNTGHEKLAFFGTVVEVQVVHTIEDEPAHVFAKIPHAVALELQRGAIIGFHVVLCMVHADVVCAVGFGGVPKQGGQAPGQIVVQRLVFFFEQRTVNGTMQHQPKRPFEIQVIEVKMGHKDQCPYPAMCKEQQYGQGKQSHSDFEGKLHQW